MHGRAEKNLIGVKVTDPGDQPLVQQDRFHCAVVFSNDCSELRDTNLQRVGTEAACLQKFIYILDQLDLAEFPLIVERQPPTVGEIKKDSRSFRGFFVALEVLKRAGHTEMESQPELLISAHAQMFAVSVSVFEAAPFQSTCQLTRGNVFQNIRVAHLDTGDPLMQ